MKKKIVLLLTCISIFLYLGNNVNAANYVNGYHSVQNNKLRYSGSSKYDNLVEKAVKTWNNYGDISVQFYYGSGNGDLIYMDVDNSELDWFGKYVHPTKSGYGSGGIGFNKYFLDGNSDLGSFSNNEKLKTITHEFGHALGLAHSNNINGNIMKQGKRNQTWLGTQDKKDYDYLWDN